MKKLIKNKKGILGLENIGHAISTTINLMPKWIRILLLLFIIGSVGFLLSFAFNVFGIYCNSGNQPVTLGGNVLAGISLLGQTPDFELLNRETLEINELFVGKLTADHTACTTGYDSGTIIYKNKTEERFEQFTSFHVRACMQCEVVNVCGDNGGECINVCKGDAFRDQTKNILQKLTCGKVACEPPPHYYFDQSENVYACADETCGGITLGQSWDELLSEKNANLLYPEFKNSRNPSSNSFVGITCTELKPKLAIYGFDLFNFTNLLILLIIFALIWLIKGYS